ncbi:MAG: T9SS type A sorting domain-containing protein, partial [Flavobacteriales bacterium]
TEEGCTDTDVLGFVVEECIAVNEEELLIAGIFPNPVHDRLTLSSKLDLRDAMIHVYNSYGQIVHSERAEQAYQQDIALNLASGMYILTVQLGDRMQRVPLVIE